jgi:hypothetical protein
VKLLLSQQSKDRAKRDGFGGEKFEYKIRGSEATKRCEVNWSISERGLTTEQHGDQSDTHSEPITIHN